MKPLFFLMIVLALTGCEGMVKFAGRVVADQSGKAIEHARIELLDIPPITRFDSASKTYRDSIFISDSEGHFLVESRMFGMMFSAPKYRIRVTKEGYQIAEIKLTKQAWEGLRTANDSMLTVRLKKN